MNHPLQGALQRTKWAEEHFRTLQGEVTAWPYDAHTVTLRSDFNSDKNTVVVSVADVPRYPSHWGRLASEAYFNLRTALDYTAWQLAIWNIKFSGGSGEPDSHTQFPVATAASKFNDRQVLSLHRNHVAVIKWLQPYGDRAMDFLYEERRREAIATHVRLGFPADQIRTYTLAEIQSHAPNTDPDLLREMFALGHPLWQLVRTNDDDKHRTMRPAATRPAFLDTTSAPTAIDCIIQDTHGFGVQYYHVGAKLAEYVVIPDGPEPKVVVNYRHVPTVSFAEKNVFYEFPRCLDAVREVLTTFWPVFT